MHRFDPIFKCTVLAAPLKLDPVDWATQTTLIILWNERSRSGLVERRTGTGADVTLVGGIHVGEMLEFWLHRMESDLNENLHCRKHRIRRKRRRRVSAAGRSGRGNRFHHPDMRTFHWVFLIMKKWHDGSKMLPLDAVFERAFTVEFQHCVKG